MVQSVLAVLIGFVVMAVLVMITTALAVRFVLRVPFSTMRGSATIALSPAYLATNVTASGIAAVVGGYTAGVIAHHDQIAHGLALAAVMVVMSLVSMRQSGAAHPGWYRVVLITVMPALAVGGAALCSALAAAP
jgi:hypothetical protein